MPTVEVTRTYLEMRTRPAAPAEPPPPEVRIERVERCPASFWRYLYSEVGRAHHWRDRLSWTDEEIRRYLDRPEVSVWVMYDHAAPAGYFELRRHDDGSVELAYFGLLPDFVGRGLGRLLLEAAIDRAWAMRPTRVWLHTCTLDHPAALPNYTKRGFEPYREERYTATIP
ncbi:MAG TPA: GNAT family N-acetyltransferase [Gemmatimonadales bacterium]|nr:GNAT family N-acetyltransferase [Gemmatimonadales bacterium]